MSIQNIHQYELYHTLTKQTVQTVLKCLLIHIYFKATFFYIIACWCQEAFNRTAPFPSVQTLRLSLIASKKKNSNQRWLPAALTMNNFCIQEKNNILINCAKTFSNMGATYEITKSKRSAHYNYWNNLSTFMCTFLPLSEFNVKTCTKWIHSSC